jgi:2-amino-4-hydroxy-6-hydroxymethyldihydropteridine diphosphokinase
MGDRSAFLLKAIQQIAEKIGSIHRISTLHETEPWGFAAEQHFLNLALLVHTELNPEALLDTTQAIEKTLGRSPKTGTGYASRPIDIDILMYDNIVYSSPRLTLPHPAVKEKRPYLLVCLNEIL